MRFATVVVVARTVYAGALFPFLSNFAAHISARAAPPGDLEMISSLVGASESDRELKVR